MAAVRSILPNRATSAYKSARKNLSRLLTSARKTETTRLTGQRCANSVNSWRSQTGDNDFSIRNIVHDFTIHGNEGGRWPDRRPATTVFRYEISFTILPFTAMGRHWPWSSTRQFTTTSSGRMLNRVEVGQNVNFVTITGFCPFYAFDEHFGAVLVFVWRYFH